jgi:hypothetical protein
VYKVATLDVDLSSVPQSAFLSSPSPSGGTYYTLHFQVEMTIQSSLEFCLLVNGVRYGAVTANYA